MPGGKRPSNPAELLSSQRFADLLDALRESLTSSLLTHHRYLPLATQAQSQPL